MVDDYQAEENNKELLCNDPKKSKRLAKRELNRRGRRIYENSPINGVGYSVGNLLPDD